MADRGKPQRRVVTHMTLNGERKSDVTSLRGGIVGAAEKNPLPARFEVEYSATHPRVIISDKQTGRKVEVPLFGYGVVREVLNTLFGEEQ